MFKVAPILLHTYMLSTLTAPINPAPNIINIKYFEKKDFIYFALPLLFYTVFDDENLNTNTNEKYYIIGFLILYAVYFIISSYLILKKGIWNKKILNKENIIIKWSAFIFHSMVIVIIYFITIQIILFLKISLTYNRYFDIILLIVTLVSYFKVILTPELFFGKHRLNRIKTVNEISVLNLNYVWKSDSTFFITNDIDKNLHLKINSEIFDILKKIELLSFSDFSFRDKKYCMKRLAKDLSIPAYHVHYIFKYHCTITFDE